MNKLTFLRTCVDWPRHDVQSLMNMIDRNREITRRTFLALVDREELDQLAEELGYAKRASQGLTMAADWHISYHTSMLHGHKVAYFRWSGIEHVFA